MFPTLISYITLNWICKTVHSSHIQIFNFGDSRNDWYTARYVDVKLSGIEIATITLSFLKISSLYIIYDWILENQP